MKKLAVSMLAFALALNLSACAGLENIISPETEPKETEDMGYLPEYLFEIADSLILSIGTADGMGSGSYQVFEMPENLRLGTYVVKTDADVSRYDRWLTISAGEDLPSLTVYDGYRDLLCYENGDRVLYYQDADGKTFEKLRLDFDAAEYEALRTVRFMPEGDPSGPLREYAGKFYPEFRMGLSEGSRYRYEDYDLMSVSLTEQTESAITGAFTYYAKADPDGIPEDAKPGTGRYEGWYYISETVSLELDSDGVWHLARERDDTVSEPDTTEPTI